MCKLDDQAIREICSNLKSNNALCEINVKDNNITSTGCATLFDILPSVNTLKKIVLEGNPIVTGTSFKLLVSKNSLTELSLRRTQLNTAAFVDLCNLIRNNSTLKKIGLTMIIPSNVLNASSPITTFFVVLIFTYRY